MGGDKVVTYGIVLHFDDNLGRGIIRIIETGERIKVTHKDVEMEGFVVLSEGEKVKILRDGNRIRIVPLRNE